MRLAQFLAPFGDGVLRAAFGPEPAPAQHSGGLPCQCLPCGARYRRAGQRPATARQLGLLHRRRHLPPGICRPKGALTAVVERLTASSLDLNQIPDFRLNLSGCPNTCGQHMLADLGFYGNVARRGQQMFPAYAVVAGARVGDGAARLARPIDQVSARDLPRFVEDVLTRWLEKKHTHASFARLYRRRGHPGPARDCDRYRNIPAPEADRSYYCDWTPMRCSRSPARVLASARRGCSI